MRNWAVLLELKLLFDDERFRFERRASFVQVLWQMFANFELDLLKVLFGLLFSCRSLGHF